MPTPAVHLKPRLVPMPPVDQVPTVRVFPGPVRVVAEPANLAVMILPVEVLNYLHPTTTGARPDAYRTTPHRHGA